MMDVLPLSKHYQNISLSAGASIRFKVCPVSIEKANQCFYTPSRIRKILEDVNANCTLDGDCLLVSSETPMKIAFSFHYFQSIRDSTSVVVSFESESKSSRKQIVVSAFEVNIDEGYIVSKKRGDFQYAACYVCNENEELWDDMDKAFELAFETIATELPNNPKITLKLGSMSLLTMAINKRKKTIASLKAKGIPDDHLVLDKDFVVSIANLTSEIEYIEKLKKEAKSGVHDVAIHIRASGNEAFVKLDDYRKHEDFYEEVLVASCVDSRMMLHSNYLTENSFRRLRNADPRLYKVEIDGKAIELKSITKEINRLKKR